MRFNPRQRIYVICETGALGDTIATFPILKLLCERGHIEKLFVDDRYLDLYRLLFPSDVLVRIKDAMTVIPPEKVTPDIPREVINPRTGEAQFLSYPLLPNTPVVHSMNPAQLMPIHAHLVDAFSAAISNCILKEDEKDYPLIPKGKLSEELLSILYAPPSSKRYVVVSYGATTEHRRMLPEVFKEIRDWFLGEGYDVVLLGKSDHELAVGASLTHPSFEALDTEGCINLIDKTTILQSLTIIQEASLVLGVDGGLIHLAGLTDTSIVAGFTSVDPYYRVIYRHGKRGWKFYAVESDSDCRYCQTSTFATFGINFHVCNTRSLECMKSLTADKWIEQIKKALGEK
jgi:ADP-heptose:LPS heptosyltransferase